MVSKKATIGMAVALAVLSGIPALAGTREWKVDSNSSYGEISTDAMIQESRQTVTLGAARVTGLLRLDARKISDSSFEFDVDPSGSSPQAGNYTVLHFHSRRAELTGDGNLRVSGPLTVSQVRLEAQLEGNEGYSGPQYTGKVVEESTREQSFMLSISSDGPAITTATAQVKISGEDFPELVAAATGTIWPAISNDRNCAALVPGSEDYSGYTCSGSAVGQPSITRTANSFGEDYPGDGAIPAHSDNLITLALHLRLTEPGANLAANKGQ